MSPFKSVKKLTTSLASGHSFHLADSAGAPHRGTSENPLGNSSFVLLLLLLCLNLFVRHFASPPTSVLQDSHFDQQA